MSKYCISCGAANAENAGVCTRCGKRLPGGRIVPPTPPTPPVRTDQNGVWEKIQKLLSEKKTRYGIGIAVLCVVVLVVVISVMNRGGIVGTWQTDEYYSERTMVRDIMVFKRDNTGYIIMQPDYEGWGSTNFIWEEVGNGTYRISSEGTGSQEIKLNPDTDEITIGNKVFHRK